MTHDTVTTTSDNNAVVCSSAAVAPGDSHGPAIYDHVTVTHGPVTTVIPNYVTVSHDHVTTESSNITSTTDSVHGNITASNVIVTDDDSLIAGKGLLYYSIYLCVNGFAKMCLI